MMYRLEFVLHGLPASANRQLRSHWRVRQRVNTGWKRAVTFAVGGRFPPRPLERARVTYTRYSHVEPDPDNALAAFKPITDALRLGAKGDGLPILVDDKPENFVGGRPIVRWEKAPPRQGRITVLVEEVLPDGQGTDPFDHAA